MACAAIVHIRLRRDKETVLGMFSVSVMRFGKPDDSAEQKARESPNILFFMRSLLAAFAVGWTAPYSERREEYVNAAFSRHLRERGGRNAGPPFRGGASLGGAHPT